MERAARTSHVQRRTNSSLTLWTRRCAHAPRTHVHARGIGVLTMTTCIRIRLGLGIRQHNVDMNVEQTNIEFVGIAERPAPSNQLPVIKTRDRARPIFLFPIRSEFVFTVESRHARHDGLRSPSTFCRGFGAAFH